MIKQFVLFVFLLFFGLLRIQAQEIIPSSGGEAVGFNGTVSYSTGLVTYQISTGTNGSVSKGVQQGYQISTTLGNEITNIALNISAFPNPTVDYLTLKIDDLKNNKYHFQLINISGAILQQKDLLNNENQLDLKSYPSGTYFLHVKRNNQSVKNFKIIKL